LAKIRIMIVDDHLVVREGLKRLLEIDSEIEVIAEAASGLESLDLIKESPPDVVLIDLKMPGINGLETTQLIRRNYPQVKVIVLTMYDDEELVRKAIHVGAHGYLLKNAKRDDLIAAIRHAVQGRSYLDPAITSIVLDQFKQGQPQAQSDEGALLTRRELEVLQAIVKGLTDREAADRMSISEHTVRSHTKSIFRKLRVSSKSQAAVRALQLKILHQ
jgi:DNA-binding NarL/FixJ family response regulator